MVKAHAKVPARSAKSIPYFSANPPKMIGATIATIRPTAMVLPIAVPRICVGKLSAECVNEMIHGAATAP